ncbi:MGMT family protein [Candidatus Berkelbacteria bacterium]|nr:MGMT family protein [Candidatus Berkelbacteria bacterium]
MTEFSNRVHQVVKAIPAGQVLTYGQVATRAGRPRAARAVGTIMKNNPCSFLNTTPKQATPCHRVVAANLKLGGFNGGQQAKIQLLQAEGWKIDRGKLVR